MTAVRHTIRTVAAVRRLHNAGLSPAEIRRRLQTAGRDVSFTTIATWLDEDKAQARREQDAARKRQRRAAERRARGGQPRTFAFASVEFKLARLQALREGGLSYRALAAVARLDFGEDFTAEDVRYALKLGRYPRPKMNGGR